MIRPAEAEDFASIMELARAFWGETDYKGISFEPEFAESMLRIAMTQELVVVLELGQWVVGFVAAVMTPLLGNGNYQNALELAYYIKPEHRGNGLELLKGLEKQARAAGCHFLNMVSLQCSSPEVAEHIYKKMGYKHVESLYRKAF